VRKIKTVQCIQCGKDHDFDDLDMDCTSCGGNLHVIYDYKLIKKRLTYEDLEENPDKTIWRYMDLLPLASGKHLPLPSIGFTPLYKAEKLGNDIGVPELYIKDECRNPSASFKDRASAIVVARAMELKEKIITTASTGNAASSLACLTAGTNLKTIIFVPETAPAPKIAQLLVFGATVITVKGTYDDAFELSIQASQEYGWYNRSTGYNPLTREGKKTCSYEICEQMDWESPEKVIVPVGDGNIISGLWKGFIDFHKLGIIEKLPQMIAVQAENSDSIKRAFESGGDIEPSSGNTIADSISVRLPKDGMSALMAIKDSGGFAVSVSDDEILKAIPELARATGVFAEPAGAAGLAGLKKAIKDGRVDDGDSVVLIATGSGLKDIKSAVKAVGKPFCINPDINELKALVDSGKI
jgi:threonine synthase